MDFKSKAPGHCKQNNGHGEKVSIAMRVEGLRSKIVCEERIIQICWFFSYVVRVYGMCVHRCIRMFAFSILMLEIKLN